MHIFYTLSSCIYLFFTSPHNLVMELSVHSSLYIKRHQQRKFNESNFFIFHLIKGQCDVYQHVSTDPYRQVLCVFDWQGAFTRISLKNVLCNNI